MFDPPAHSTAGVSRIAARMGAAYPETVAKSPAARIKCGLA